ncbi:hypothetical protein PENSPDRAFT_615618 [Peniophora sp. CONT]|nr:hypothetical protein PENSPDRAFT_615618 [Peniophora sp. CONT]
MGLSGRKQKQRIGHDPRNLAWADDAAKFGQQYLSKFGWDASKGLGAEGEGRTSHLKVSQKLDMLGIGHAHQNSPDGIAWKQNRDFENLLKRLNGKEGEGEKEGAVMSGFHRPREEEVKEDAGEKRKRGGDDDGEVDEKEAKRRRKEEKAKRKEEKAKRKAEKAAAKESSESEAEEAPKPVFARAPPRSHRARHIRMKRLAASDSTAMSEILGVSSSSLPSTPVPAPAAPASQPSLADDLPLEKLTTSTFSVADYFKAKLAERSTAKRTPSSSSSTPVEEGEEEKPRMGLGMRARVEDEEEGPVRMGLGASSKFASMAMFAPARTETVVEEKDVIMEDDVVVVKEEVVVESLDEGDEKEERRKAKEARKAEKAERKRLKAERKALEAASVEVAEEAFEEPTKKRKFKSERSSKKQKKESSESS